MPDITLTATSALPPIPAKRGETILSPAAEGVILTLPLSPTTAPSLEQVSLALPATGESLSAQDTLVLRPVADRIYLLDPRPGTQALLADLGQPVVDQSDYWVPILLQGPRASEALARHWKPDLHPDVFPPGRTTRSTLGPIACILLREGMDGFRLFLPRSFARAGFAELAETLDRLPGD